MPSRYAVPLVVVEEHHETFYVWHHGISAGWMPQSGNTLLHIDEHHDLWRPVLNKPLSSIASRTDAATFTYNQLGIGNFIWPAVFQGIFKRMLWMRYGCDKPKSARLWSIWPKDARELEFQVRFHNESERVVLPPGSVTLEVTSMGPGDYAHADAPYVMDIDLDYFACNRKPRRRFELEITTASYEQFNSDPYNLLRLPSDKVVAERRNGRCVLIFNEFKGGELNDEITNGFIEERITRFGEFLDSAADPPNLIVICRSLYSGYTPAEFASFVQNRVVEELSRRFEIEPLSLEDIVPENSSWHSFTVR